MNQLLKMNFLGVFFSKPLLLIVFILFTLSSLSTVKAEGPSSTTFDFFPKMVHYQGSITVLGSDLDTYDTGISQLEVVFSTPAQSLKVNNVPTSITEGQFKFSTIFGDPIPARYHIDVGPGVPERIEFEVYIGGKKANQTVIFDPEPVNGCKINNCYNVSVDLTLDVIPRPTPTAVPPTPTPLALVNPSLYSGEIRIGSTLVPDNVEVYAILADYQSDKVKTSGGKYSLTLNPGTINYVGQDFNLIIQGIYSLTTLPFEANLFTSDSNFLFPDFEVTTLPTPMLLEESTPTPIPTPTPTSIPPEPERIIIVATPTPSSEKPQSLVAESTGPRESEPMAEPMAEQGGGCSSSGGGNSSISIFSLLLALLFPILSYRKRLKFTK